MSAKKLAAGDLSITKDFMVANKLGIHARPAAMFVKTANRISGLDSSLRVGLSSCVWGNRGRSKALAAWLG